MATKSELIYAEILAKIKNGTFSHGTMLPAETILSQSLSVSRPTIAKVFARLKQEGYIEGRQGTKYYVTSQQQTVTKFIFGILAPRLDQDESRFILDSIYSSIAALSNQYQFSLLWAGMLTGGYNVQTILLNIEQVIVNYKKNNINGIFFTPIEFHPQADSINEGIMSILNQYDIPCILLERDYRRFPYRGKADLVSIDNIAAGYIVTNHFISQGYKKIAFVYKTHSAYTVAARIIGYRQALLDADIVCQDDWLIETPVINESTIEKIHQLNLNHIVCGNDFTAMKLISLNQQIVAKKPLYTISFDDAEYAMHLSTPLSTYKQPLINIAQAAVETLLQRINSPKQPIRTVLVEGELILRASSEG